MGTTGIINVTGLRLHAMVGVLPDERMLGNDFNIDISLRYPVSDRAWKDDELQGTLNYALLVDLTQEVMKQPANLLEYVAWRLRDKFMESFPAIAGGKITIAKLTPPIDAVLDSVSVTLEW